MFIGREKELSFLENCYQKKDGQLVVLYGRRRVGKTETLLQFSQNKRHIFYSCIECSDNQQLEAISQRILTKENPASRYITKFDNWTGLFDNIEQLTTEKEKLLLIIDEFPYMVKGNSSIPSILQNMWDLKLKNANIMLVLCGSAMSFMEKEILAEKNPLYGRATGILKMQEMSFQDASKFLPDYSVKEQIECYAILGGIPHYYKQFREDWSLEENVINHILTPGSILYSEVEFLLKQELRETSIYNSIIQAVALGNTKLNDIFQKTQIEKTKLSVYLKNLIDLGIIWREFSVDAKVKEEANVNRGIYRLTDNYFAFWYTFVYPNTSELTAGDAAGIWKYAVEPKLNDYVSYAFEKICWQYLRNLNQKELLPFHFTRIGHWWNKTDEIDIMATDAENKQVLLGECKYKNAPMKVADLKHLQGKAMFDENVKVYYWLFSKSGYAEELVEYAKASQVMLVEPDSLICNEKVV